MKANTDRAQRFAFDIVAEQYDNGRPRFDLTLVNRALLWCSNGSTPKQVLEIGAGTGQLTRALAALSGSNPEISVRPVEA